MHRIDGPDTVTVFPTPTVATPQPGFFAKATTAALATVIRSDWLNAVQGEIEAVVIAGGLSLDKTLQNQMQTSIASQIAFSFFTAFAGSIGGTSSISGTTLNTKAIICAFDNGGGGPLAGGLNGAVAIASGGGAVTGEAALLAASTAGSVSGDRCVVMACSGSAGTVDADATESGVIGSSSGSEIGEFGSKAWVIGSNGCDVGKNAASFNSGILFSLDCELDGNRSVIIASSGDTSDGDDVDNNGTNCAIVACLGEATRKTVIATGVLGSVILAAGDAEITDGTHNAIIASGDEVAGSLALNITSSGARNAIIASLYGTISGTASHAMILASGASGTQIPIIDGSAGVAVILACTGRARISTGAAGALIACIDNNNGTNPTQVTGGQSWLIGIQGACVVSGGRSAIVCSSTTGAGPTLAGNNILAGASGTALTWQLDSAAGRGTFNKLTVADRSTDTGGPAPTDLGNLPTGATAGQVAWLRINDGVNDLWIRGYNA